jgi:WD40 repeat protein
MTQSFSVFAELSGRLTRISTGLPYRSDSSRMARLRLASWADSWWGYDVFIAHRRADAADYAKALYARLRSERIACFIDKEVYGPGDSLLVATSRHVAKSTVLVLLASPELLIARHPVDWVDREIADYLAAHSVDPRVIVVDFDGTLELAIAATEPATRPVLGKLAPFLRIAEEIPALGMVPSEAVLAGIRRNLRGRRRDRNRLLFFQGVAVFLAVLLTAAVGLGIAAWRQKTIAEDEARRAHANEYATKARGLLGEDPRAAALVAVEAIRQTAPGIPEPAAEEALAAAAARLRGIPLRGHGRFRAELAWVESVTFADDVRHAAVGDWSGWVYLWDLTYRLQPRRMCAIPPVPTPWRGFGGVQSQPVDAVGLSRDASRLAVVTRAGDGVKLIRVLAARPASSTPQSLFSALATDVLVGTDGVVICLSRDRSRIDVLDLNGKDGLQQRTLIGSRGPIRAMTLTADGRSLAALHPSRRVTVVDVAGAERPSELTLPPSTLPSAWNNATEFDRAFPPTALRLSSDRKYLALLAKLHSERTQPQQMAEVWRVSNEPPSLIANYPRTPSEFGSFDEGQGNLVTDIEFSPDASSLIVTHNDQARIWDLTAPLAMDMPPSRQVTLGSEYSALAFSPDSSRLALGDLAGNVLVVDLTSADGEPATALAASDQAGEIHALKFSKRGDLLLAAGDDDAAWILDPNGAAVASMVGHLPMPRLASGESTKVSEDHRVIAALTAWGIWLASPLEMSSGRVVLPQATAAAPASRCLALATSGRRAAVTDGANPRLFLVDLEAGLRAPKVVTVGYSGPVLEELMIDRSGDWVVLSDGTARALVVSARTGKPQDLDGYRGGGFLVGPQGDWLLSGIDKTSSRAAPPRLWRLTPMGAIPIPFPDVGLPELDNFTFSPDGGWLAASQSYQSGQGQSDVFVWQLPIDGQVGPPSRLIGHSMVADLVFSRDGRWLLTFDDLPGAMEGDDYYPKRLLLWRIPEFSRPVWERSFRAQSIYADFSADSSWMTVATDRAPNAMLIDLEIEPFHEIPSFGSGGNTSVYDWRFTFSPDGEWLTTAGVNAPTRLWRITGRRAVSLVDSNLPARKHVAFGPDGRTLTTTNDESSHVRWLTSEPSSVRSISLTAGGEPYYAPDGARLVLRSEAAIDAFELDWRRMVVGLMPLVGRNLTWNEWNARFPGRPYAKTFAELPADVSVAAALLERAEAATETRDEGLARDSYEQAANWAIDAGGALAANDVAWSGANHGFAEVVLPAAEFAVRSDPANGNYRDTRGVARCVLGDAKGAYNDFVAYVDWATRLGVADAAVAQRRGWMAPLRKGWISKDLCLSKPPEAPNR